MENEKVNEAMKKGVAQAQAVYAKGNELMDRVSFLKNPLYKKIVWGVLGLIVVLAIGLIFRCGSSMSPFDVVKETMVAAAEGDLETFFKHVYIKDEMQEKLSKASDAELELLEKQIVKEYCKVFDGMEPEELKAIQETMRNMKEKSTKIDGDKAKVTAVITQMGEENQRNFCLRKVDGEWKLDMDSI